MLATHRGQPATLNFERDAATEYGAVAIATLNEDRAIDDVLDQFSERPVWLISAVGGLRDARTLETIDSNLTYETAFKRIALTERTVLIVLDFQHRCQDPAAYRALRDALAKIEARDSKLVLIASAWALPPELQHIAVLGESLSLHEEESIQGLKTEARSEVMKEWARSTVASVGLLGIRIGVSDVAELGSVSLFVAALWFFFAIRRENREIGTLLVDTQDNEKHLRWMVFHGVIAHMVFVDVGAGDNPIDSLEKGKIWGKNLPLVREVSEALFFLPCAAVTLVIASDLYALFAVNPPVREAGYSSNLWQELTPYWKWRYGIGDGIALFFMAGTLRLSSKARSFAIASRKVLRTYLFRLDPDAEKQMTEPGSIIERLLKPLRVRAHGRSEECLSVHVESSDSS